MLRIFFVIALLRSLFGSAWGCSLCAAPGNVSLSPTLETAQIVVLARANPKDPQEAKVLKVLKGQLGPSEDRIILAKPISQAARQDHVLCIYKEGSWRNLGATKDTALPVIDHILQNKTSWSLGADQHLKYIRGFFDNKENQLREFAFSELARAPYSEISSFAKSLSAQELRQLMENPTIANWNALYILISAHSGESFHQKTIREQLFKLSTSKETSQLAPWTGALIELDQEKAFSVIQKCYLDREISYIEMDAIVQALSTHGNDGHRHLRPQIIEVYQNLIKKSNRSTQIMLKDLHKWGRTELAEELLERTLTHYSGWQQLDLLKFLKDPVPEETITKNEESEVAIPSRPFLAKWGFLALLVLPLSFQIYRFKKKRSASL